MKKYANFLIGIVCVIVLYNLFGLTKDSVKTEIATRGSIEDQIRTEAYVVRNETILVSESEGLVDSYVSDGERVSKGKLVGMLYKTKIDTRVQSQLKTLNERIANLEKLIERDNNALYATDDNFNSQISARISETIIASHKKNGDTINQIRSQLDEVLDQNIVKDQENAKALLDKLKNEKKGIETKIPGDKNGITASAAGLYFSFFDGFEDLISPERMTTMMPSDLKQLDKVKIKNTFSENVAKIISGFEWSIVFTADEKTAQRFLVGENIHVRLRDYSEEKIPAVVTYISNSENGNVVMGVSADIYYEPAYFSRKINVDIIKYTYSGLKVSKEAIEFLDGVKGVYIIKDSMARFRPVEILLSNDKFAIVREDNSRFNNLLLYDVIITHGTNLENGKLIKK